jgi:hypothetical protein
MGKLKDLIESFKKTLAKRGYTNGPLTDQDLEDEVKRRIVSA